MGGVCHERSKLVLLLPLYLWSYAEIGRFYLGLSDLACWKRILIGGTGLVCCYLGRLKANEMKLERGRSSIKEKLNGISLLSVCPSIH